MNHCKKIEKLEKINQKLKNELKKSNYEINKLKI